METIKITIPDNLTPEQEIIRIAKQIGKKMLPSGKKEHLALGDGYEIKHLQTIIKIERKPTEDAIVTQECFCGTVFLRKAGHKLYTNYGGTKRTLRYCSETCRQSVIDIAGEGRVSKTRNLKPFINFHKL